MATYVTSDAHGHLRALDRALQYAQPGSDDTLYVLGDMVDRGPAPVGVIKLVRALPHTRVLMGNHERMLLDTLLGDDPVDTLTWQLNGGYSTLEGLEALPREEYRDIVEWLQHLPLFDVVDVPDGRPSVQALNPAAHRIYLFAHAGIDALALRGYLATAGFPPSRPSADAGTPAPAGEASAAATGAPAAAAPDAAASPSLGAADAAPRPFSFADVPLPVWRLALAKQDPEDLLWIRGEFWSHPTGLVGPDGAGPVVIAGHTPSILLAHYAACMSGTGSTADGLGCMVEVGACADTGGIPDRIDIDCSAAAGSPQGRVGVMRLEDGMTWYATINEGE